MKRAKVKSSYLTNNWIIDLGVGLLRHKVQYPILSLVSRLSAFSLIVSVAAILFGLSIVNYFDYQFRHNFLSLIPQATVTSSVSPTIENPQEIENTLKANPNTKAIGSYARSAAVINYSTNNALVQLLGVTPSYLNLIQASKFIRQQSSGNIIDDLKNGVALGDSLSSHLGIKIGDIININVAVNGSQKLLQLPVTAILQTHTELDKYLAFINRPLLNKLLDRSENSADSIQVLFNHPDNSALIIDYLPPDFNLEIWQDKYKFIANDINLVRQVFYVMLLFIMLLSTFNISSVIFMLIKDKKLTIAIMKSMGMSESKIINIFIVTSLYLGIRSIIWGLAFGIVLCLSLAPLLSLFSQFGIVIFEQVYFISTVGTKISLTDITIIIMSILSVCVVSAIVPAMIAVKQNPVSLLNQIK